MSFKGLISKYKDRYCIPRQDLAEYGESNRIHTLVMSFFLFWFGVIDLILVIILHYDNLQDYIFSIIYFSVFAVVSFIAYFFSRWSKSVPREKAYVIKTIPAYFITHISLCASVYNFYILGQPYNGMLAYCFTGFLGLLIFSVAPSVMFISLLIWISIMVPGIYSQFGLTGLMDSLLCPILVYCAALYKRRLEKKNIIFLKKQKKSLEAKTFGNFTLMYEDKVVKFSRTKSEELMGYLIYKKGSSVKTKELISVLWGDHADSARYGSNLRNLIVDIRHTLNELEIQNLFITEYNNFRINPEVIKCDYYDFLKGDPNAIKSFTGEFMSQYSWAEETAGFLEMKALKK